MDVGTRLKQFRELKGLSQGKIEGRTGLLRCYFSRVENGRTVPSVETLEKFACIRHALVSTSLRARKTAQIAQGAGAGDR
jgi:transcriptional regulator with XRE-family HTH domain